MYKQHITAAKEFITTYKYRLAAAGFVSLGIIGLGMFGLYYPVCSMNKVLKQEPVTLEGKVIDERYVSPVGGFGSSRSSEYFFSIEGPVKGRATIEVMDSDPYNPLIRKESVDAKLQPGTSVVVRAREITAGEYMAFAGDISITP